MTRKREWLLGSTIIISLILLILIFASISAVKSKRSIYIQEGSGQKIAIVRLTGPIYSADRLVRYFKQLGEQRDIRAIVFRIDSPGGGVAASQEIYEAVKAVRNSGKPIIASMGTVAASGGYYVACGADSIVANPGTTTGSIGVIAQFMTAEKLLDKIGIKIETIKSGPYKDTGSYHRKFSTADAQYLQAWVDDAYAQFTEVVSLERRMSMSDTKKVADGRVFTGRQAMKNGLVDRLGDFQAAINLAADMAGIKGKPAIIYIRRKDTSLFDLLFQQVASIIHSSNGMALMYRMP
ncbi:signal peptide peptidase SppA [bacterium]|nr:signal peptide peptidase SppA [bacterium]